MDHASRVKWYRTEVDKAELKKLMERSDARGLVQSLLMLGLSVATGALAYYSFLYWPWWVTVLTVFLHGSIYCFHGEHAAIHELSHGTPFKNKKLNAFFYGLFGFLAWSNVVRFRQSHTQHHMVTVHTDRDLEVELPWLASSFMWLGHWTFDWSLWLTNFGRIFRHSFGVLRGEWEYRLFPETEQKLRRKLFNYARFVLIGHLVLATVFILTGHWFLIVLVTFGAFWCTGVAWLVTYTQHAGLPGDVADFRICCRSVKVNPFTRFLHWQMDYHIEHHMFAAVPFYNLKKVRQLIEHDLPEYESILASWKKMRPILKEQRKGNVDCKIVPELPASAFHTNGAG